MYSYVISALKREWGKYYQDYVSFCDKKNICEAVEIIVLSLRSSVSENAVSWENESTIKDIKKSWLDEVVQKDEFIQLVTREAKQRKKRNEKKGNFKIAVEATTITLRNIYKDIDYRLGGKRTYAKKDFVSIIASLPITFKNEVVSRKTLQEMGFVDINENVNLDFLAEIEGKYKATRQKTFLLQNFNLVKTKRKKTRKNFIPRNVTSTSKQLSLSY